MAWSVLLKADLNSLAHSWVLRGWIIALALTEFFTLTHALVGAKLVPTPASGILAANLDGYLLVWSCVIIVLGAGSVSLEADIIADGILSRACTRTQYIVSKFTSRALVILGIYLVFAGIAGFCAWRYGAIDVTIATICTGVGIVGLAILMLIVLGVTMSVVFDNTILSVIVLFMLWYVASPVFSFLGADYLSPTSLVSNLPAMLKDPHAPEIVRCSATTTSLTVVFSKDMDAARAEQIGNYQVECPAGETRTAATAAYDKERTSVILGGMTLPAGETVKVTTSSVTDAGGNEISPAADSASGIVTGDTGSDSGSPKSADSGSSHSSSSSGSEKSGSDKSAADIPAGDKSSFRWRTESLEPVPADKPAGDKSSDEKSGKDNSGGDRKQEKSSSPGSSAGGPPRITECIATASSLKVLFSRPMDRSEVETLKNYVVENPFGKTHIPRAASYDAATRSVVLSGLDLDRDAPVKVTIRDVHDSDGRAVSSHGSSAVYREVTTWKYVLGFGIPTILAALLGIGWFSKRDL